MSRDIHRHIPIRKCDVARGVVPKTELPVEALTNPASDSTKRRLLEREITAAEETHIGLHKTDTKYATKDKNVFRKKAIKKEILPRDNPRCSSTITFPIQNRIESVEFLSIIPDLSGVHILTLPVPQGPDLNILASMQEDISWCDTPVSALCMEDISGGQV